MNSCFPKKKQMKSLLLMSLIFISNTLNAQVVVNSQFKARSFRETLAPYMMAKQQEANARYNEAYNEFSNNIDKVKKCVFETNDFKTAVKLTKRMVELNSQYGFWEKDKMDNFVSNIQKKESEYEKVLEICEHLRKGTEYEENKDYQSALPHFIAARDMSIELGETDDVLEKLQYNVDQCEALLSLSVIVDAPNHYQLVSRDTPKPKTITEAYQTVEPNKGVIIKKISNTSKNLIVECEYTTPVDRGRCSIEPTTYILDKRTNDKYIMLYSEGIAMSPAESLLAKANDKLSFKLVFPPLPQTVYCVDLIEDTEFSTWKFYNLRIR